MFLLLSVMLVASCKAQRIVKFTAGEFKYLLDIPGNYNVSEVVDDHGFREHRIVYPDSSIIYITNDTRSGGATNTVKAKKYGNGIYLKILSSDTLNISGKEDDEYWREQKIDDIVVGYMNVPLNKKDEYDMALSTLRRRE